MCIIFVPAGDSLFRNTSKNILSEANSGIVKNVHYLENKKIAFGDNLSRQAIQIEGGIPPRYLNKGRERCDFQPALA